MKTMLEHTEAGLALVSDDGLELRGDFARMLPRLKLGRLQRELLVRAAKVKPRAAAGSATDEGAPVDGSDTDGARVPDAARVADAAGAPGGTAAGADGADARATAGASVAARAAGSANEMRPLAVDATAGLGEDALLLAAAGFRVRMHERNPVIAALLRDAMERAADVPQLADAVARMELVEVDSESALPSLPERPDVVLLDPMFPARSKSAAVKKKAQLLQSLELPCQDERALLDAARAAHPRKIVVKRPLKGAYLAGVAPSYSLKGKAVRYDCIVLP